MLELARRHLDMDLAFLAEFTDGKQVYREVAGDAASFGWQRDDGLELSGSYCRMMTRDDLPNAIPDTRAHVVARALPVTEDAGIGSYVGVPIRLDDGTLYGSFCCVSHDAADLDERDVRFMAMLAELVAAEVQSEQVREAAHARVRELIEHERVATALQPIAEIDTGRVIGVEALTRFPDGHGRTDEVFAGAHDVGLGIELERLAARKAFALLPMLATDQYLAVNLTPEVAMELAGEASKVPHMPYARLVLEITEHAAVQSYGALRERLAPARARGLRLAIDDAGAGYASLHHVIELSPDIIKVDRSLVDGSADDRSRRSAVGAFVALAADLGATVVAEGVEHVADLDTVRRLGAQAAQGYLLARPSTNRADLATWVKGGVRLPAADGSSGAA